MFFARCNNAFYPPSGTHAYPTRLNDKPPAEPGKCYQKCLISEKLEQETYQLAIYTGNTPEEDQAFLATKTITIRPASTKWVKKRADRNCRSSNPDDCLVWCLVETPAQTRELRYVTDTLQLTSFKLEDITVNHIVKRGGFREWVEVVCHNKIDQRLLNSVCQQLYIAGAITTCDVTGVNDPTLQAALSAYQRTNQLPVGSFNIPTLQHMGLQY